MRRKVFTWVRDPPRSLHRHQGPLRRPQDEKTLSNIQEVTARSGRVIALALEGDEEIKHLVEHTIQIPQAPELLLPLLEVVPLPSSPTTSLSAEAAT